ncbi:MAG: hypothetical protein R3C49_26680 [Planctomycetaceae bacterium]
MSTVRNTSQHKDHSVEAASAARHLQKTRQLIAAGDCDAALHQLGQHSDPESRNLRGICLMRTGRTEQAVQLYRLLLLDVTGNVRTGSSDEVVINFATALLISGRPAGCLDILWNVKDRTLPAYLQLKSAIDKWSRTLPLWARLNWVLGKLQPDPCIVPIDFPPGILTSESIGGTDSAAGRPAVAESQKIIA